MLQILELKIPRCPGIRNKKHCVISIVLTLIFSYVVSWFFVVVRWVVYGKNGVAIKYTAVTFNYKNIQI